MSRHDVNDESKKFYSEIIDSLWENKPVSVVRYGDGELACVMLHNTGRGGKNADGDDYYPPLCNSIKETLVNPILAENFYPCLGSHCRDIGFVTELKRVGIWNESIPFRDAFVFVHAGIDGRLQELIDLLNTKYSIFVAPKYLHELKIDFNHVIEAPVRGSWRDSERLEQAIEDVLPDEEMAIVIMPVGMGAVPLIHSLYRRHGSKHTFIDFGSPFDAYVDSHVHRSHFDLIENKLDL